MRLITSPRLNKDDFDIVEKVASDYSNLTLSDFGIDLDHLENEFERNHVKALGWMLGNEISNSLK